MVSKSVLVMETGTRLMPVPAVDYLDFIKSINQKLKRFIGSPHQCVGPKMSYEGTF